MISFIHFIFSFHPCPCWCRSIGRTTRPRAPDRNPSGNGSARAMLGKGTAVRMPGQRDPGQPLWAASALHWLSNSCAFSPAFTLIRCIHFAVDFGRTPAGAPGFRKLFTWAVSSQPQWIASFWHNKYKQREGCLPQGFLYAALWIVGQWPFSIERHEPPVSGMLKVHIDFCPPVFTWWTASEKGAFSHSFLPDTGNRTEKEPFSSTHYFCFPAPSVNCQLCITCCGANPGPGHWGCFWVSVAWQSAPSSTPCTHIASQPQPVLRFTQPHTMQLPGNGLDSNLCGIFVMAVAFMEKTVAPSSLCRLCNPSQPATDSFMNFYSFGSVCERYSREQSFQVDLSY